LEDALTTAQVAALLGVSDQTIRMWISAGKLPGYRITEDSWYRVDRQELERFAQSRGFPIDWSRLEKKQ